MERDGGVVLNVFDGKACRECGCFGEFGIWNRMHSWRPTYQLKQGGDFKNVSFLARGKQYSLTALRKRELPMSLYGGGAQKEGKRERGGREKEGRDCLDYTGLPLKNVRQFWPGNVVGRRTSLHHSISRVEWAMAGLG